MTMQPRLTATIFRLIASFVAAATLFGLGGCGGGGTANSVSTAPGIAKLSFVPATATVYFNTPTVISLIGGQPPYQIASSDSSILPVSGAASNTGNFLLVPNNVAATTTVILTGFDGSGQQASAEITVQPAPLLNTLTVTPTPANPGAGCGTAVCSGGDAIVTVQTRNVPGGSLAGRQVRFDVVQPPGPYKIQCGSPAVPVDSCTVTTGQDGVAFVRITANADAFTQVTLISATDLITGQVIRGAFTIAKFIDGAGALSVLPADATFTGPDSSSCAVGASATYFIFGGVPPYRVTWTFPAAIVQTQPIIVPNNGGSFTLTTTGAVCVDPMTIIVTDQNGSGRFVTVTLHNKVGSSSSSGGGGSGSGCSFSPPPPGCLPLTVTPNSSTIATCGGSTSFFITGGTGTYNTSSTNALVSVTSPVTASGFTTFSATRVATVSGAPSGAGTMVVNVGVSDGTTLVIVPVTVPAAGLCNPS